MKGHWTARAVTTDTESMHFVGQELRSYWKRYPGVTHLRASASWFLSPGFALTLLGDNLLDRQTGEPDNITVLPGRTFSLGFRADF
jgi:iron complex outermembrane receptor protein